MVATLAGFSDRVNTAARHLRTRSTLICAETHAPIPDAAILRGALNDYRGRLPTAADAWCVIEVTDASYGRDAGEKLEAYARAGVQQYVILNLRNRTAEVYLTPDRAAGTYPLPQIVAADQVLDLRVGEDEFFQVPLANVLP